MDYIIWTPLRAGFLFRSADDRHLQIREWEEGKSSRCFSSGSALKPFLRQDLCLTIALARQPLLHIPPLLFPLFLLRSQGW